VSGACRQAGSHYGYLASTDRRTYAIAAISEAKRGNASVCGTTIDSDAVGSWNLAGVGLTEHIIFDKEHLPPENGA